jgi:hypothetical protein
MCEPNFLPNGSNPLRSVAVFCGELLLLSALLGFLCGWLEIL